MKIRPREKRRHAAEREKIVSPHRVSPFLAWVIFTRDRVSLALLSLRKNGGLLISERIYSKRRLRLTSRGRAPFE